MNIVNWMQPNQVLTAVDADRHWTYVHTWLSNHKGPRSSDYGLFTTVYMGHKYFDLDLKCNS
jgi:hypothetical protein